MKSHTQRDFFRYCVNLRDGIKQKYQIGGYNYAKVQRQSGGTGSKTVTEREIAGVAHTDGSRECPGPEIRI